MRLMLTFSVVLNVSLLVLLLIPEPPHSSEETDTVIAPDSRNQLTATTEFAAGGDASAPSATQNVATASDAGTLAEESPIERLIEELTPPEVVREMDRRRDAARDAWAQADREYWQALAELPIVQPLPLPPEFDWLSESPSISHELIQREAVDPEWSAVTENKLIGYFGRHPEITDMFGFPTVHCRSTRCEIQVVRHGVTEQFASNANYNWSRYNRPLFTESWADEFGHGPNADSPVLNYDIKTIDGVTTILWHIVKQTEPTDGDFN